MFILDIFQVSTVSMLNFRRYRKIINNFVQHSGTWVSGIFFVVSPPLYCMVSQHRFAANMEDVDQDICV